MTSGFTVLGRGKRGHSRQREKLRQGHGGVVTFEMLMFLILEFLVRAFWLFIGFKEK